MWASSFISSFLCLKQAKKTPKGFTFEVIQPIPICGDIRVEFFHKDMFKKVRYWQSAMMADPVIYCVIYIVNNIN